jgi:beta-lactamase class A
MIPRTMHRPITRSIALPLLLSTLSLAAAPATQPYTLDFTTAPDPALQSQLEQIDSTLRAKFNMKDTDTAVGLLDLTTHRLAVIHADREDYAASIPKVGILLAYFQLHPEAATNLDPTVRHELGLMAKQSNNEMATQYSRPLTLPAIQNVLNAYGLYDKDHGGGIWVGKHYGPNSERIGSPVADNSHAATVRQLLRYFLMLEQGQLVSPEASKTMRDIFASPDLAHDDIKFVKGLAGRDVQIIRKWGTWQDWHHDAAVVTGGGRHYILVALTRHKDGDAYLEHLAPAVDDLLAPGGATRPAR